MEKIGIEQFEEHYEKYKLLPVYESAYHTNHSSKTGLIKIVDDIIWNMEFQKGSAVVAIELSAAFDTVDHKIML